ncbi:insulinase family protein [Seonamhaeicola sediminis]|uniref:Insulinase family protein n=1 Tax=Seonamhaeicola sediminis TaxID=2528206 RepID=A0A562YEU5_9FLAO|nr:insulinase family protein [Seonamhaeicola sediminis]TWO33197.1 insulinase family protein [Seonamhaeicola sediminis]
MKYLFAFLLFFISTVALSQENTTITYDLESEIPKDTTATRGELSNGLKYYIKENDRPKDVVNMRLVVKVGHLQEDDKQQGLAHLLEHMGFNGTKNFKKDKLVKYLESIGMTFGADLNAHTNSYETVYKLKVPSSNLKKVDKAFQILEDWAHNMSLKDDAIDDEKPVVLEEFRARLGSGNRVGTQVVKFMYEGMPQLRYFSDEKLENIQNFESRHLHRFYKDWYRPNLMGIIVAGDIDPSYVEKKIKKHFSKLVNPEHEKPLFSYDSVPYHKETRVKIITDPEKTTTSLSLDFININPIKRDKILMKHQKESFLIGMMTAMLNKRLVELSNSSKPPFIAAGAGVRGTLSKYHGKFSINASSSEEGVLEALNAIVVELERVKRFGFTKNELDEIKKNMLASNETFLENKDDWYSSSYLSLLEQEFKNDWVLYLKEWRYNFTKTVLTQITIDEVNAMFNFYYHEDNRVLILTAPEKKDLILPTEENLLSTIKQAELNTDIEKYVTKELDNQLIKELRPKGSIVSEENHLYEIKELVLSNGAKVYYKKTDFDKESIRFKAFSYGGNSLLSDQDYIAVGQLVPLASVTGIGGYKSHELPKVLAGKKVNVSSYVSIYDEGLNGSVRGKDLETLFKLIYLNFTSINKDEETYLSIVDKIKASTKNRKLSPSNLFYTEINKVTQKGNPRYINMNENDNLERLLDSVPYVDIYESYTERFKNAGDFKFFFIGDFDEDILKNYTEVYLASLPSTDEKEEYKKSTYKNVISGKRIEVHKGLEEKATLLISFEKEAEYLKKEHEALRMFGQIFRTRLRNKIREEKGGVYTVNASLKHVGRPFSKYTASINFNCLPENINVLEEESLKVLREFIKEGPTKKEVAAVKESWILNRKKALETNGFWLNHMYNKVYWKHSFKGINDYEDKLSEISHKYIKKTAKKYIDKPSFIAKLLPELKAETNANKEIEK